MTILTSNSLDNCNSIPGFIPSGTRMSFSSSSAPSSWTKESNLNNNRALRVTTGTATPFGTGTVFNTVFPTTSNNKPVQGSINAANSIATFNQATISVATLGAFNPFPLMNVEPATISNLQNASHSHVYQIHTQQVTNLGPQTGTLFAIRSQLETVNTGPSPAGVLSHTHAFGLTESHSHPVSVSAHGHTVSSSGPHLHPFTTTAQDFNIKYVDIIICIKN